MDATRSGSRPTRRSARARGGSARGRTPAGAGLAHGESYTASAEVRHPGRLRRALLPLRRHRPDRPRQAAAEPGRAPSRAAASTTSCAATTARASTRSSPTSTTSLRGTIDVTYREPDLKITAITLHRRPAALRPGRDRHVHGRQPRAPARRARSIWADRLYLSRDPSLDPRRPAGRRLLLRYARVAGGRRELRPHRDVPTPGRRGRPLLPDRVHGLERLAASFPRAARRIGASSIQARHRRGPRVPRRGQQHDGLADRRHAGPRGRPAGDQRASCPSTCCAARLLAVRYTVTNFGGAPTPGGDAPCLARPRVPVGGLAARPGRRSLSRRGRAHGRGALAANGGSYTDDHASSGCRAS